MRKPRKLRLMKKQKAESRKLKSTKGDENESFNHGWTGMDTESQFNAKTQRYAENAK